jgi:hypothetical protein
LSGATRSAASLLSRHPGVKLWKAEMRLWRDLWFLIRGRVVVPEDSTRLPATNGVWFLPAAVTVATLIEIIVFELLLPWQELRIILAIASIYSLAMMWAMLGRQKTYPHYVGEASFVLRRGGRSLVELPGTMIQDCVRDRRYDLTQASAGDGILVLGAGEGTNIRIILNRETRVCDPDRWPWQRPQTVEASQILLWLDNPEKAMRALHRVNDHHVTVGLAGGVRRHRAEKPPGQ